MSFEPALTCGLVIEIIILIRWRMQHRLDTLDNENVIRYAVANSH